MHLIKNLFLILSFASVASFSQQADSTSKATQHISTPIEIIKENSKMQLKKQISIRKNTTSWTKIKDLFM